MGVVFRQSAKNAVVVMLGAVLGALTIWLNTKYNTKQQLGFTRTLTNYAVTFSLVLVSGLNSTLVTYIHRYADQVRKQRLLVTLCLSVPLIVLGLMSVVYYIFRDRVFQVFNIDDRVYIEQFALWLPVYTLFFVYMTLLEQYLGSQMKVAVSAFMREVLLRIAGIILIFLFGFGYIDFGFLVRGMILIYLLPLSVFFLLALTTKPFGLSFRFSLFSNREYRELIHFSWYHLLFSIAVLMLSGMDALLIPVFDKNGLSSMAVYSVAIFLVSFLQLPFKALLPASFTVLAKAFAENDMVKAKDLFLRSSTNILIPSVGLAIVLCCNLQNAVMIIKGGYAGVVPVFLILFIGNIVNIATGMNDQVLSIAKYYKFNFYLSLMLITLLFMLIYFLVPRYGLIGAAWSTTSILLLFNVIKCWFIWKKLDMLPFSGNTIKIIACGLPALAAGYLMPDFFHTGLHHIYVLTFGDAVLRSLVICMVYAAMLVWLKPSEDLVGYLASIRESKKLF